MSEQHYLKDEFFELIKNDTTMFNLVRTLAPAGVWFWDLENPEHEWLDATFWQTLGYASADIPDRSDTRQANANQDDMQVARENIQAHLADPNYPYNQVIRYRHKDGSTVWLRCRGMAIREDTGKPLRMLGVFTNVTARKNAEECQRKNAEAYLNLLDNQKAYIIRTDAEANYTYANDLYLTRFNLERDVIMGMSSMDSIYVEDHPKTLDAAKFCLENPHQPFNVTLRKRLLDGTLRTSDWEFTGITDDQGNVSEILCIGVDVTEKLEVKADLLRTLTLLEDAGRIANMGAWELDVTTDEGTFTDQVYAIHELPVGTLIDSATAFAFYHPDDRPSVAEAVNRAVKQQEPYDLQCRFITAKGNHRWIRTSGYPVVENGRVTRLIGMFQDITKQKEGELALHESERRYRLLADNSRDLISLRKLDNTLIYASPAYEQLLGYSQDELPKLPPEKVLHPDDTEMFLASYRALRSGRTAQELQYRLKKKDGTYVWVEVYVSVITDASGEQRILASSRDITDRKRAEDALRESEAKFRSLVENANDVIVMLNPQGEYLYISPKGQEMTGVNTDGFIGQSFEVAVHPEDIDKVRHALSTIISSKQAYEGIIYRALHGDGSWRWYASSGAPLLDNAGNVTAIMTIIRDITSDKRAEQAMQATLEQLEQSHNQNIVLLKEVHHRVKNNLAVISALLALRANDLKDPIAKEALQESRTRIKVMAEVHELMYHPDNDNNERIAFERYLSGLVDRMQRSFGYNKQQIAFSLEVAQCNIGLDQAVPLGLIINELLTNAVKHAFPDGHADPRVTITATADNGLTLTVTDNGVGVDDTTNLEASNSLGMTVINSLTEQLEGQVTFANRPSSDVGLQVTLRVPLT